MFEFDLMINLNFQFYSMLKIHHLINILNDYLLMIRYCNLVKYVKLLSSNFNLIII